MSELPPHIRSNPPPESTPPLRFTNTGTNLACVSRGSPQVRPNPPLKPTRPSNLINPQKTFINSLNGSQKIPVGVSHLNALHNSTGNMFVEEQCRIQVGGPPSASTVSAQAKAGQSDAAMARVKELASQFASAILTTNMDCGKVCAFCYAKFKKIEVHSGHCEKMNGMCIRCLGK